jgi:hypothetical protein
VHRLYTHDLVRQRRSLILTVACPLPCAIHVKIKRSFSGHVDIHASKHAAPQRQVRLKRSTAAPSIDYIPPLVSKLAQKLIMMLLKNTHAWYKNVIRTSRTLCSGESYLGEAEGEQHLTLRQFVVSSMPFAHMLSRLHAVCSVRMWLGASSIWGVDVLNLTTNHAA